MRVALIRRIIFPLALLFVSSASLAEAVDINDAIAIASSRCGYDLSELRHMLISASRDIIAKEGVTITFQMKYKSKSRARKISARMSISCSERRGDSIDQVDQVPDATSVIQNEDAGGRYFRHIASQKVLKGRNWRVSVAVVDYVLGDGQRVKVNEVVACNADAVAPCINLMVDWASIISCGQLKYLYLALEKIAVTEAVAADAEMGK